MGEIPSFLFYIFYFSQVCDKIYKIKNNKEETMKSYKILQNNMKDFDGNLYEMGKHINLMLIPMFPKMVFNLSQI